MYLYNDACLPGMEESIKSRYSFPSVVGYRDD
jgi:hypothetical protein